MLPTYRNGSLIHYLPELLKLESPHQPRWTICQTEWDGVKKCHHYAWPRVGVFLSWELCICAFVHVKGKQKVPKSGHLSWCLSEWVPGWYFCSIIPAPQPGRRYAETDILGKECFSGLIALPFWTCPKVKHFWIFDVSLGFSPIERQPNK